MTGPTPGGAAGPGTPATDGSWLKHSTSEVPPRKTKPPKITYPSLDVTWDALRSVYDPELYLDVVSLGLVYDVREEAGRVIVEMTMTTPGCPASEALPEMARTAVADALGGALEVDVRVVWDPPWSPAMVDEQAAAALGFRAR